MVPAQNYVTVSRRPLDVEDYIDLVRRHRSWIVGPTFAGLVIAIVVAFLWPDTYKSTASLRITPQTVPERLVPSVSLELNERVSSLRTAILSRNFLLPLIQRLNLYPRIRSRSSSEDAFDRMQKDIKIDSVMDTSGKQYASAFQISFTYTDRFQARAVVEALVTQFMSENVRVQKEAASTTQGFMSEEVKGAQTRVDQLQQEVAKFQTENQGKLPEEASFNQTQLNNVQMQLGEINQRISTIQQNKNSLDSNLGSERRMLELVSQGSEESAPAQTARNSNLLNLQNKLRDAEVGYEALKSRYTAKNPVVKETAAGIEVLRRELARLRAQDEAEQAQAQAEAAASAESQKKGLTPIQAQNVQAAKGRIQQLQAQMQNADSALAEVAKEKRDLEKRQEEYLARINGSPWIAQQFAGMNSELMLAKERLNEQKRKELATETATNLEARGGGEQLEVLDGATLPTTPVDPNRYMFAFGGICIGALAGLVLAGAKEARDSSLKNLKDVRAYTNLPVLSSIPLLENALLVRRKRRLYWLAWSSAVIVGVMAMGLSVLYYYHGQ
jgi:polysaccharide biosynthesis transport protein